MQVTNLKAVRGPGSVTLAWNLVGSGANAIIVKWRKNQPVPVSWQFAESHELTAYGQTYTVTGLQDTVSYDFEVAPVLFSAYSETITVAPKPTAQVRFTRSIYGGALASTDLTRQSIVTVQADAAGIALANQVKATNARTKVLIYVALDCVNTSDQSGTTTAVAYSMATQHETWFLHRNRLRVAKPGDPLNIFTNFGDPGWQSAATAHVKYLLSLGPFDGVFFDNVQTRLVFDNGPFDELPTDIALQAAVRSALSSVAASVRTVGKIAIGNIPGNNVDVWSSYVSLLDGGEMESWTNGNLGLKQQVPFFQSCLDQAKWCEDNHKTALVHTWDDTQAGYVYALAAMLLVNNGNCMMSTSTTNYSTSNVWYPECDKALMLGNPTGPYSVINGIYSRSFANGSVVLNTNTLTAFIL